MSGHAFVIVTIVIHMSNLVSILTPERGTRGGQDLLLRTSVGYLFLPVHRLKYNVIWLFLPLRKPNCKLELYAVFFFSNFVCLTLVNFVLDACCLT